MDALIKEFFTYDAHSGVITWVKNRGGRGVAGGVPMLARR